MEFRQQAVARRGELGAEIVALRAENAALAERGALSAALTAELQSALTEVHNRLAGRLELLTSEVNDMNRRAYSAGQQDGSDETRRLYLDLLQSALTGVLARDGNAAPWAPEEYDPERRLHGSDWPKSALTMIGTARMRNLRRLVETVLVEGIAGDLLEAGAWRGGACVYMRGILAAYGEKDRTVWVADSFAGLPKPDERLYPADQGDPHHTFDELRVSLDEVKDNFKRFGLLDEQVAFLQGWFKDTLPQAPIAKLAILRLDGDMYSSTIQTLDALYDKVAPGGYVIIDDYILKACRQATDDFRAGRGIIEAIQDIDGAGVYWRKVR